MPKFKGLTLTCALLSGMQVATIDSATNAHAVVVPLPVSHATATANALKTLLLHRKFATLPVAGTGSATVRINNRVIKSIVTGGYSAGQNQAITSQLGGAIKNGNLNGAIYFNSGLPTGYFNNGSIYSFAIGGAPQFGTGSFTGVASTSNTLSFAASAIFKQHNAGTVLPYSGGISGAEKARTALYKSLATTSTAAGQKSVTALGPITGGELYGTFGQTLGGGIYAPYTLGAIAFGSSPYNTTAIPILPTSQFRDYLTFANGATRTVTGGQLAFNLTFPTGSNRYFSFGGYGIAFGNSIYNNGIFTPFQQSLLKNVLNLARLK